MTNKICIRLEQTIEKSKYDEFVAEMANRNLKKPVAYSQVLSNNNVTTVTFDSENFQETAALLGEMGIKFTTL